MYLSDEDYNFIYSRVPRICVDLMIVDTFDSVLLTKRDIEPYKDHWHFPGGRIKFRETVEQAITRILKAELGYDGKVQPQQVGVCEFLEEVQGGNERHSISLVHRIRLTRAEIGHIKLDHQSKEAEFFSVLPDLVIPAQREFLWNHRETLS